VSGEHGAEGGEEEKELPSDRYHIAVSCGCDVECTVQARDCSHYSHTTIYEKGMILRVGTCHLLTMKVV
jgi:hypothetical protein